VTGPPEAPVDGEWRERNPLEQIVRIAVWGAVAFGVGLRLVEFAHRRSLWIDEAMLALNVLTRDYAGLLLPLDWMQVAPPGYLWLERTAALVLGPGEPSLRLASLLAGTLLLPVAIPVARRLVHPTAALPVVTSLACNLSLVGYANEVKPYALDAFAALLLSWLTLRALDHSDGSGRLRWALGILPLVSLPAAFVGAGALGALALREGRPRLGREWWIACGVWAGAAAASLWLARSDPGSASELRSYWHGTFLIGAGASVGYVAEQSHELVRRVLFPIPGPDWLGLSMFAGLAALGASRIRRVAGTSGLVLAIAPLAVALGAVVIRQYPFAVRLWVWSLPSLTLLAVAGGYRLVGRRSALAAGLALLFSAAVVGTHGRLAVYFARHPDLAEHSRPVVTEILDRTVAGDVIYVFARATPAWLYYSTDWDAPPDLRPLFRLARPGGPLYPNAARTTPLSAAERERIEATDSEGRTILHGRSTGHRLRHTSPPGRDGPLDPSWAATEVDRVRANAPDGCAWTFEAHVFEPELDAFDREVAANGGVVMEAITGEGARARRVCFVERD
jgi:hypothetical protein